MAFASSPTHKAQAPSCGCSLVCRAGTHQYWELITTNVLCISADKVEPELLHTYSRIDPYDTLILCVRLAVLTAVTLTVPIVLFPVSLVLISFLYGSMKMMLWYYFHAESYISVCPQVRKAIMQMLFPTKSFNWLRHIAIALVLLTFINMLVIFAPNILGIFGIIG